MGCRVIKGLWAVIPLIAILLLPGSYMHPPAEGHGLSPEEMPGVYEIASRDGLELSVADMHRYDQGEEWVLALGMVMKNTGLDDIALDPVAFQVVDDSGRSHSPAKDAGVLKNMLLPCRVAPGETAVGSLAFCLDVDTSPVALLSDRLGIRLDKVVTPPGVLHPPGEPVRSGNSTVGIAGISGSEDERKVRVDYVMKYSGTGPASLDERACGKFGVLIDSRGMSYAARDYKILAPVITPGSIVEGYMTFEFPKGTTPRYLLFWPPDDDGIFFDLGARGQG